MSHRCFASLPVSRGGEGAPPLHRLDWPDVLGALMVAVAAFLLYLRTLAPGLLFGDPGEIQFAVPTLGLLHPTGYPLFTLLGWLWAHVLPFGDMAWRMNAFAAFWGGVAAGLTYLVVWQVSAQTTPLAGWPRRAVAALAALVLATSPTVWSQAVIAEVYTLHLAFVALIVWLTLRHDGRPRSAYALALAFGLSLTHHRTTLLLLPAIAAYLWPPPRRGLSPAAAGLRWRSALLTITPLLLYTYIPWRGERSSYLHIRLAPDQMVDVYPSTWSGFLTWVSGSGFAGALHSPAAALAQLPTAGRFLWSEFGLLLALPCLTIILWMVHRRWRLLACTGLFLLGQLAFNLFYGIGDVFVMYIPMYFIAAVWAGAGLATLAAWPLPARLTPMQRFLPGLFLAVAFGVVLWRALDTLPQTDRSHDTQARALWAGVLSARLPSDAILLSNDRDEMTPLFYLQQVERRAVGMTGLFPHLTADAVWRDIATTAAAALATGRPVYLIKPMPGLEVRFNLHPADGLVRVTQVVPTGPPQQASDVVFGGALRLAGYDTQRTAEAVQVTLYWHVIAPVAADYTTFVQLLSEPSGAKVAQSDHRAGGDFYPTTLWKPGETLRDTHTLPLAQAVEPAGFRLLVGLYQFPSLVHLGEPAVVGVIHNQNQERMGDDE